MSALTIRFVDKRTLFHLCLALSFVCSCKTFFYLYLWSGTYLSTLLSTYIFRINLSPPQLQSRFSLIDLSFLQVLTPAGDLYSHHVPELGRVILQPYSHPAHPAHPAHSSDEDNYQKSRKWRTQDHQILDVEVQYLVTYYFNL